MADNTPSQADPKAPAVTGGEGSQKAVVVDEPGKGEQDQPSFAKTLSEVTGKQYLDDDKAIAAVKETYKYVSDAAHYRKGINRLMEAKGLNQDQARALMDQALESLDPQPQKPAEPQAPQGQMDANVAKLTQEVEDIKFFKSNPNLEKHQALLSELRGNSGKSFTEIAESDLFKSTVTKLEAHDELEGKKSVLQSNSRLGQSSNKMSEAREALAAGDHEGASRSAVASVIESME